jgi:hypothetical protein
MNKYIVAAMLLSAPAFGANGILIQKGNQQYVVIPDCQISEDVKDVRIRHLHVGAPIHMKHEGRRVRCRIEEIIEDRYAS